MNMVRLLTVVSVDVMKVHVGSRGIAALILNVGISWSPVVNLPLGKNPCTHLTVGWGAIRLSGRFGKEKVSFLSRDSTSGLSNSQLSHQLAQ